MSKTAQRFTKRKPVLPERIVLAEHFAAMDAEQADFMAMLASHDYGSFLDDSYERLFFDGFEDEPDLDRNYQPSANRLFLDMCYDEEAERERRLDDELEEAAATVRDLRFEHGDYGY